MTSTWKLLNIYAIFFKNNSYSRTSDGGYSHKSYKLIGIRPQLTKLIAAHAIALGATLVTNNVSDFTAYPELTVENWVSSH